jgi:hypothetical protein
VNRPEIIAIIIIALTLFALVKWGGVQWWHLLLIFIAVVALEAYSPIIPHMVTTVIGFLTSHVTALIHH